MNNVGTNISAFANLVAPFSPLGKQAVGLENAEAKEDVFPPAEEPTSVQASTDEGQANTAGQTVSQDGEQRQQQLEARQQIQQLAKRDREVRAHELAHAAVGGQYSGSPTFTYERGPDGVNYAVAGEVSISLPSIGSDPEQALNAANQVRRAALAPADPSAQDRSVAAGAMRLALEARAELAELQARQQRLESEQDNTAESEREIEPVGSQQSGASARQQRANEFQQGSQRSLQLDEKLITLDSVLRGQNTGAVIDQEV